MKRTIRLLAIFLCAVLTLCAVSCVKDHPEWIPEGMQVATAAGDDFRLFIPTTWNLNTSYGMSGGYFNLGVQSTVSAVKYPVTAEMTAAMGEITEGEARIHWFYTTELYPSIESATLGGSLSEAEEKQPLLLHDANAWRYHCKGYANQKELHFVQVVAERGQAFYVISFICDASIYATLVNDFNKILEEFYFDLPYEPDSYAKALDKDAPAPEGMKLASNDDVAYRFYVPIAWTVNQEETIFSACLEDRTSVSVVPYMPDRENMSVSEFFAECQTMMKSVSGEEGFAMLSEETKTLLGGREATVYHYRFTVGANTYYYRQVVAAYKSMIYSVTYTAASPEALDAHLADFNRIVEAFTFR